MKNVIVVVEFPKNQPQWTNFITASGTEMPNEYVEKLADNVWQIDFEKSPTALGQILYAMKQYHIPGRILPLAAESQWLQVDSNPEPR